MSLPKKVVIDDVEYVPQVLISKSGYSSNNVKKILFEIFYIFYFDHWHRKNGPISSCINEISPDLMDVIDTGDMDFIKSSIRIINIGTIVNNNDGKNIKLNTVDNVGSGGEESSSPVLISGVKYVPKISVATDINDAGVREALVALAESYLYCDDDYHQSKTYVRDRLLKVFDIFSPDIKRLIVSNKNDVVYGFLSDNEDFL